MVKNARLFIRVRTNSQAIRTDPYGDSDRLFVRVHLHNRAVTISGYSGHVKQGAHMTKPGWSNPIPIHHPTNLALFGHKITLYRFNQGGGAHTIAGGSNRSRGLSHPNPLTLTTGHYSMSKPNLNPNLNTKSKNNVCSTKPHRNIVQHSVLYKLFSQGQGLVYKRPITVKQGPLTI